jgi:eukaryotic-like serine/threonine-protein kinase
MSPDPSPTSADAGAPLGRGASIGRYIVLAPVGRGSMGEVYAAYDPELDRKVAMKLLRAEAGAGSDAAEAKARLLREAQAIARLSHPNVIVVHDVGSFGNRVFIAMEYVDGHTLGFWLNASPRRWQEVIAVFLDAGRGLAAAHASNLVHRDFKPDNVMIGRDRHVRVMDFGLARDVGARGPEAPAAQVAAAAPASAGPSAAPEVDLDATMQLTSGQQPRSVAEYEAAARTFAPATDLGDVVRPEHAFAVNLTQTGALLGTPAYMPPELFLGQPGDARSDQFSFAVALYEALYGERPFVGPTMAALSASVLAGAVRPPPESTRVPGWVRRVVMRGLRRDPAQRWPSMTAMLEALARDPRARWRRWAAAATAATAAIVLVAGLALRKSGDGRLMCLVPVERFTGVWEPAPQGPPGPGGSAAAATGQRAIIAAAFHATGKPYAADAFTGTARLLDRYVRDWSAMYTEACESTNLRGEQSAEVLDLRMSCLRDRWKELAALTAVLARPDGEIVSNAVKAAASLDPLDRCADVLALRAALPPPRDPETRRSVEQLHDRLAAVKAQRDAGRHRQARDMATAAVADARTLGYAPTLAAALARLGSLDSDARRPAEAEAALDEACLLAEATRADELVAEVSIIQIYVAGDLGHDMARAWRWRRHAEAFLTRLGGHELLRAWMLNDAGTVLYAHKRFEEAAAEQRRALQIKERMLGPDHPDVGYTLNNVAISLAAMGRPAEALAHVERALTVVARVLGRENPHMAVQLTNRAEILNQLGRHSEARRDAARAVALREREFGADDGSLPFMLGPLGEATLGEGLPRNAVPIFERALALAEQHGLDTELPRLRSSLARARDSISQP